MDGTSLRIFRSVHKARDTRVNCGSRAHRARFNCSKQLAVAKPVITDVSSSLAEGDNFGVCGRIAIRQVAVPASSDDATGADDDRSYRDFARFESPLCATQGFFHPQLVGGGGSRLNFVWRNFVCRYFLSRRFVSQGQVSFQWLVARIAVSQPELVSRSLQGTGLQATSFAAWMVTFGVGSSVPTGHRNSPAQPNPFWSNLLLVGAVTYVFASF
jgi:hypothetical protein